MKLRIGSDHRTGFTLVELMIVVVVLGILTALAVPRFSMAAHKSREKEAELILGQVYTVQSAYMASHGTYAATVNDLLEVGFERPIGATHYVWADQVTLPLCLASTGVWNGRRINLNGEISDC
jgi:prepilin-type N-terminal cleavage/methylation domain-containing protein